MIISLLGGFLSAWLLSGTLCPGGFCPVSGPHIPYYNIGGSHGHSHGRMVVGFTTTCAISAYTTKVMSLNPVHGEPVLDTTLCNKVCQRQVVVFYEYYSFLHLQNWPLWNIVESGVKHYNHNRKLHMIDLCLILLAK